MGSVKCHIQGALVTLSVADFDFTHTVIIHEVLSIMQKQIKCMAELIR